MYRCNNSLAFGSFSFSAKITHHLMILGSTALPFFHFTFGSVSKSNQVKLADSFPLSPSSASLCNTSGLS
jgi:hypothetical protein